MASAQLRPPAGPLPQWSQHLPHHKHGYIMDSSWLHPGRIPYLPAPWPGAAQPL